MLAQQGYLTSSRKACSVRCAAQASAKAASAGRLLAAKYSAHSMDAASKLAAEPPQQAAMASGFHRYRPAAAGGPVAGGVQVNWKAVVSRFSIQI